MFSRTDLDFLLEAEVSPAVSLYMPTHRAGPDIQQDPIRFDNLLGLAADKLAGLGVRPGEAAAILKPARDLAGDYGFWRTQDHGLALFAAPGLFRLHRLPLTAPELVVVAGRFHVAPLLPLFSGQGRFFVVTLTADGIRLFEGGKWGLTDLTDDDFPKGIGEILAETRYEQTIHANPTSSHRLGRVGNAGSAGDVPQAQNFGGSPEDTRKAELLEYLRRAAGALGQRLSGDPAPVVLVAQPEVAGNFRRLAKLKALLPQGVEANPDGLPVEELHQRAYALVQPAFTADEDAAIDHFNTLFEDGDRRASMKPEDIVAAAHFGRVDTLVLAENEHLWGHFDESSAQVIAHRQIEHPDDEDLLDRAAAETLKTGGVVKIVPRERVPYHGVAAAVMRWPEGGA